MTECEQTQEDRQRSIILQTGAAPTVDGCRSCSSSTFCCHQRTSCSWVQPKTKSQQFLSCGETSYLHCLLQVTLWLVFLGNVSSNSCCSKDADKQRPKSRRKMPSANQIFYCITCLLTLSSVPVAATQEGKPPSIVASDVTEMTAHVGDTLVLPCLVSGNPFPDTTWTKDGQTIEKDWKRFRVSQVGLRIRNVQATDSGTYYCQAVNGYGAKHVQVLLVVKDKKSDRRHSSAKPIFTEPIKMRKQKIVKSYGHDVRLKCKAKGKPRPRIQWFKDGNLTAIGQDRNGSRPQWTLVLREVNSQSSGKYTCRVWNEAGEITYVYTLKVIGHIRERPMLLTHHPVNTTVGTGERTSIQCRVRSQVPPTIKWIKRLDEKSAQAALKRWPNNTVLKIDGLLYLILPEQETMELPDGSYLSKLVISRAREVDTGKYICFGANTMGYNYRSAFITVLPSTHRSIQEPKPKPRTETSSLSLPLSIGIPSGVAVVLVCFIIMYCFCARDRLGMLKAAVKKEETAEAKKTSETRRFVDGVCELPTSFADDENMDPNSQAEYRSVNVTSDGGGSDMDTSNIYTYPFVASTSSVASTNHPLLSIKTPFNADVTVTSPIDPEHSSGFSVGFGVPPPPPPSQHSRSPSSDATSSSRRHRHRRHSCSRESRCYHHHHHHAHRHGFAYRHHHRQDIILPRHPPEYSEDPTC